MARCSDCKAKLGSWKDPRRNSAGNGWLHGEICRNCWERRHEKKLEKKAEGNWFERAGAKIDAKTAELNAKAAELNAQNAARQTEAPAVAPAPGPELVACSEGHLNHPSRTECLVCGRAFWGGMSADQQAELEALRAKQRGSATSAADAADAAEKECPMCAEMVKARARICRFCQHAFSEAAG